MHVGRKRKDGSRAHTKFLPEWVAMKDKQRKGAEPCEICGAAVKATKATGCSYLSDAEAVGPEATELKKDAA